MTDEVNDISTILAPLSNIFSLHQVETLLYAYLPSRLERCFEKTGIYTIDVYVINAIVTLSLILLRLTFYGIQQLSQYNAKKRPKQTDIIAIVIDSMVQDDYRSNRNVYHQAICHLLSTQAQKKSFGMYNLKQTTDIDKTPLEPPPFYMVPQPHQVDVVDYQGLQIEIAFMNAPAPPAPTAPTVNDVVHGLPMPNKDPEPAIQISTTDKTATVATLSAFLDTITKTYLVHVNSERNKRARARYEYITQQAKWARVCTLHNSTNVNTKYLSTVALCPENERRLLKDLDTFVNSKAFYKRVGFPFRRGYLLHGKPGTGKTSLVLAMASYLQFSLYFINLGYIRSDAELVQAFSTVPTNAIVVFEDVDTQSTVLHQRSNRMTKSPKLDQQDDTDGFNLSTFLSILDGHTLEDGIIFIMTTNHKELLDPAVIRPGRMDSHFDLTYATHYQMRRIFSMAQLHDDALTLDDIYPDLEKNIPEFAIPPSEVMQTMVLYRDNLDEIPQQLDRLVESNLANNGGLHINVYSGSTVWSEFGTLDRLQSYFLGLHDMVSNASEQESAEVSTTQLHNNDISNLLSAPQSSVPPMQRLNSSQSLAHLPRDTTFILHERDDSDLFDITSISTADEWTRSHGTLPQHIRLHPCETMQTTSKRPSFVDKLFRSKSANTTLPLQDNQGDYFAHSSPTNDSSSVSISMGDDNSNLNNPHAILYRSATLDASNYPNLIGDNDDEENGLQQSDRNTPMNRTNTALTNTERSLSRSTTATTMNSSNNATRPPSRFSFISRRTTRLRSVLSRPPSYKRYDDPEQEEQQARDIAALRRLEQCYENDRNAGLLHQLIWAEEGEKVPMKQVLTSCVASQFTGFYMAFWVIIFVFLGAVSVFVPDLPQAAKALWIPLALYCVGVLVFFGYHRRHAMEIDQLEQQVGRARRRRLNELLTNMELPNDHYFVIEDRSSSHAHPVITLLPPPPNYAPMTRPTISGTASASTRHNAGDEFLSPPSQRQLSDSFSLSPTSTNSPSPMLQVPSSIPPYPQSPSQPQHQEQREQSAGEHDDTTHRWQVSQAEETMELEHSNHPLYRPS